jgi:hypothetical protein
MQALRYSGNCLLANSELASCNPCSRYTGSTFSLCLPSQVSTTNPDWAQATKAYLAHQKVNPIFGAASKA